MFISKKNLENIETNIIKLQNQIWGLQNPAKYEVGDNIIFHFYCNDEKTYKGLIIEKEISDYSRLYNIFIKDHKFVSEVMVNENQIVKKIK